MNTAGGMRGVSRPASSRSKYSIVFPSPRHSGVDGVHPIEALARDARPALIFQKPIERGIIWHPSISDRHNA
jgi:hypothetical protein